MKYDDQAVRIMLHHVRAAIEQRSEAMAIQPELVEGLLVEVMTMRRSVSLPENERINAVQQFATTCALHHIASVMRGKAKEDFGTLGVPEVLLLIADSLDAAANEMPAENGRPT